MANPEHLAILTQGDEMMWNEWNEQHPEEWKSWKRPVPSSLKRIVVWNEWRKKHSDVLPDLVGADLSGTTLIGANLHNADLRNADLSSAYLLGTKLNSAKLLAVKFIGTHLENLDLAGADFSRSLFSFTVIANIDLGEVKGLETVGHTGPSTIGIDTIIRSEGKISEVFLRGCGVPDTFIQYARSLVAKPIQFFSCFISHSGKDKKFCDRLYTDLQANGVRVWYFYEDAIWGEIVWGEIDRSIKVYDKLIVVCSKHSLTSGPVLREMERALIREDKEGKNILFPIRIDGYLFNEWEHPRKADVMSKVVGDFRGWSRNTAKYDGAFRTFLKALKAGS